MAYSKNPFLPKVRRDAVNLVKYRHWSMRRVAKRYGVEPSTISRWCRHPWGTGWHEIHTESSRPKKSPRALPKEIVEAIIQKRIGRRRCGQVIHQELKRDGIIVSLSSVQRTLERSGMLKKRSAWARPHDRTRRPEATSAGALVEIDTVHFVLPDGSRLYLYTLIDLYSRWAYVEPAAHITTHASVEFVSRAQKVASFAFSMIQTDHGSEFQKFFRWRLGKRGMKHRYIRVRQKDDNAHIERFNRTVQEECTDGVPKTMRTLTKALKIYLPYYNGERLHMGINYQTPLEVLRRS